MPGVCAFRRPLADGGLSIDAYQSSSEGDEALGLSSHLAGQAQRPGTPLPSRVTGVKLDYS